MASTTSLWKGKGKSTDEQFEDLFPVITYHHLHSQTLGVRDPLRVIALCDGDAFYAACEVVRLGIDRDKPLVVLQWGSLIAVNYPARKFGISRMDKVDDAMKRCPDLIVVHVATYREGETEPGYWEDIDFRTHKVSLDYYRRESMKILQMFKDTLPGAEIEKASIDESFMDLTLPVRTIIMERYPHLASVPSDAPNGMDTPLPPPPPIQWDDLGALVPITPPPPEDESVPEGEQVENEPVATWHDVALSIGAELMGEARTQIFTKLGYTTSAGIARNKFLAKLTASYKKPMGQTILRNAAIPNYLRPVALQKIRFLGGKLGAGLAKEYDAATVEDILSIGLEELQAKFGESAFWVYEILRGIDRSEVKEKSATFKSMLASKNLPTPIRTPSEGYRWIRVLAAELALRLNDTRKINRTAWPKSLVLHVRQGYGFSRSKQSPFPFAREVTVDVVAAAGDKLWKELIGTFDTSTTPMKISNVALAFTGLEDAERGQASIESFFKSQNQDLKRPALQEEGEIQLQEAETEAGNLSDSHTSASHSDQNGFSMKTSFTCPRCSKRIAIPESRVVYEGDDHEAQTAALMATLKQEHDDFHFAQDLARTSENIGRENSSPNKKRRKEPRGIAKFFKTT